MTAAAIFDLDRTLLAGSSTPAINSAMWEAGLVGRRSVPGQGLMMAGYRLFGESVPSMALARAAVLAVRGKPVAQVTRAAQLAAEGIERDVLPYVRPLLDRHRAEGRVLCLATTTPRDLLVPLAERLGFDHLIATRWARRTDADGVERYTGGIDGGFVWAVGKLLALRRWAADSGISLGDSWGYSDSVYDLPFLESVGHPTAVNPDLRLLAAARLQRWPVLHLDAPAGVPKLLGAEPMDVLRWLSPRAAFPYVRFDIEGTERIPRRGPVIVVANHRSYFDPTVLVRAVFEAGRLPRGMAKKEVVDAPLLGTLARAAGVIRVDRDGEGGGKAAFAEAEAALRHGELVMVLPQGTIPRGEAFFDPKLVGKTGAARLAAATGAPVVPIGLWGTEAVWPRSSRLPDVTTVLHPPTVRARVGEAIRGLGGTDAVADTEAIMAGIVDLLPPEAAVRRIPSAEELARTIPPNVDPADVL